jgi:hypothetical protein
MVPAFLGLALLLSGNVSKAQAADPWSYFFFEEMLQRSCDDPTLRSAIALPQPKLILETSDEGTTKVKARVGVEIKDKFVFNVEVTSPRNPSGETTTLADLNGLSGGSTARFALSWFGYHPENYTPEGLRNVKDETDKKRPSSESDSGEEVVKKIEEWVPSNRMAAYSKPAISRPSAVAMFGQQGAADLAEEYQEWMKRHDKFIPVLTIDANAEQKEFKFFTPAVGPPEGLKKTSKSHMNHAFTASAGAYLWGRVYSALNYRRGTKFVDGMTKEFCSPSGPARVLDCTTLVVAHPKREKPEALELEVRSLFGSFGVAAHLTRDLEANVTAVEVPIYFLQKMGASKMELNGGAKVRWQSDTRDYAVSVFIGPALSTVLRMNR